MSLHWKMRTDFPFSKVFILGIILSLLGLASMIISIIAFVTQSWGHYAGTGMWGGAIILASGLTAVFVSQLRSQASVKTFCVFSVFAVFTSLIMLILSAGGLSLSSGFYSHLGSTDYNKRASNLIHASLLVNAVFCLSGSILAVIVCCKYLVFEHHDKPKCHNNNRNILSGTVRPHNTLRGGAINSSNIRSTNSRTPLNASGASRRHSDNVGNRVQIEYRRCHKHSVTEQPSSISHCRRQRHSQLDPRSNNTNVLSPCGVHYLPDRRNGNRSSGQAREVRGDSKERERLNIVPLTQLSSRPFSQIHIQTRLSGNPVTTSPKIHLPTEFDEEDLPPYEAVEASSNAIPGSHSDSGDESDTENSSSTDAHSYNAAVLSEEGAHTVPVAETQNMHIPESHCTPQNSEQHKKTNVKSLCEHHSDTASSCRVSDGEHASERHTDFLISSNDHKKCVTNEASCSGEAGAMIIRKDSRRSNRLVLSYINTQPLHQKDCQRLLSVSHGVEPVAKKDVPIPHPLQENFYENGPCYENLKCADRNAETAIMNHLSKSSSSDLPTISINATLAPTSEKENQARSAVPVKKVTVSSPVSNTSPQLLQNNFGSTVSAFRPVCGASSALCPSDICPPTTQSPLFHLDDDGCEPQNSSPHIYINTNTAPRNFDSISGPTSKYIEQGAIPKDVKNNGDITEDDSKIDMSLKNIHLFLSYNHCESASNESEKKLPSKMIPFADSKLEITCTSLGKEISSETSISSKQSPHVCPVKNLVSSSVQSSSPSVLALKSLALPVSLFGTGAEAVLATPAKLNNDSICETALVCPQQVPASAAAVLSSTTVSSVREASTQVNSVSTSRWHSRRMGGNQSLLQNRREELLNSQLCRRAVETSARTVRPSSMPLSGAFSGICHGISGLAADRQSRNRSNEASSTSSANANSINPLPLSSYLGNLPGQQPQSLALSHNHLLQHYPLQPQQPRLGVQLHQRRQQQHQLQQNIESQHQQMQQQLQQPPQLPQQANQQNLQGRNGRPLFSVLL